MRGSLVASSRKTSLGFPAHLDSSSFAVKTAPSALGVAPSLQPLLRRRVACAVGWAALVPWRERDQSLDGSVRQCVGRARRRALLGKVVDIILALEEGGIVEVGGLGIERYEWYHGLCWVVHVGLGLICCWIASLPWTRRARACLPGRRCDKMRVSAES